MPTRSSSITGPHTKLLTAELILVMISIMVSLPFLFLGASGPARVKKERGPRQPRSIDLRNSPRGASHPSPPRSFERNYKGSRPKMQEKFFILHFSVQGRTLPLPYSRTKVTPLLCRSRSRSLRRVGQR